MKDLVSNQQSDSNRRALIYLVDDEPILLDLAELSLRPGGYMLKKFQSPEEAWKSFLNEDPKPVMLITDYAMEGMNGLSLIEKCKGAKPTLKTMLISGTAGPDILNQSSVPVDGYLPKPYAPDELLTHVRHLISA